jgi:hypothetical protein
MSYTEGDWYIEPAEPWRMDVLVEDDQPEDTGLLDAHGNPSFRARSVFRWASTCRGAK